VHPLSDLILDTSERAPIAIAAANAKPVHDDLTLIKRADGKLQWAEGGKPLYTHANDKKPGDMTGDGMNSVWHVVRDD